ncbi:conserved membrane protein of unknown function [Rhodovastum atsumiense]|uniref:Uncharacterized protein n=1 Tax=Rhodovastum atsumiense TaxID=504468 RepID=A0A5M6ILK8_9PROT|nr:hypothetical protein [Rhodovastum atsumiense]KAA5609156.1 hypothetical protein F1189_25630 [Rhodovastum atsumiense]CAH2601232.1 conserved membrane protein of unknown function [Rhodovastum atsumiense]
MDVQTDFRATARSQFLNREAAEVYLLLDYLSGRSDKSLAGIHGGGAAVSGPRSQDVSLVQQATSDGGRRAEVEGDLQGATLLVRRAMAIKYPLTEQSASFDADAAFLVRARDVLNSRAWPANGSTIAFTLMVSGEQSVNAAGTATPPDNTALQFAKEAFPGLVEPAVVLLRSVRRTVLLASICLVAAIFLAAYTALGKTLLDTYDAIRRDAGAVRTRIASAETAGILYGVSMPDRDGASPAAADLLRRPTDEDVVVSNLRRRMCHVEGTPAPAAPDAAGAGTGRSGATATLATKYAFCDELSDLDDRISRMKKHLVQWAYYWPLFREGPDEQTGPAVMSVLGNYILPILYGFLGSAAFVLRRFEDRLGRSLLTPRVRRCNNIRLALGALSGACIGLFSASSAAASQERGFLGLAVTLSASALAFLAGYSVEAVFRTLDALMNHVFRVNEVESAGEAPVQVSAASTGLLKGSS